MAKTDINQVLVIGNLTKDMELSYLNSGTAVGNMSVAVNRSRKQGDEWVSEVSYFEVRSWGKTAENLKPYLTKGKKICAKGFLKQDRWEKDGQKFSKVYIVAEDLQLLSFDDNNSGDKAPAQQQYYQPQTNAAPTQQNVPPIVQAISQTFSEDILF